MNSETAHSPTYILQFPCPDPYVVTVVNNEVSSFYKQQVRNIPKLLEQIVSCYFLLMQMPCKHRDCHQLVTLHVYIYKRQNSHDAKIYMCGILAYISSNFVTVIAYLIFGLLSSIIHGTHMSDSFCITRYDKKALHISMSR